MPPLQTSWTKVTLPSPLHNSRIKPSPKIHIPYSPSNFPLQSINSNPPKNEPHPPRSPFAFPSNNMSLPSEGHIYKNFVRTKKFIPKLENWVNGGGNPSWEFGIAAWEKKEETRRINLKTARPPSPCPGGLVEYNLFFISLSCSTAIFVLSCSCTKPPIIYPLTPSSPPLFPSSSSLQARSHSNPSAPPFLPFLPYPPLSPLTLPPQSPPQPFPSAICFSSHLLILRSLKKKPPRHNNSSSQPRKQNP